MSSAGLQDAIRTHGRPGRREGREADDVVLDEHVRPQLVDDLGQPRVDVLRAVDQRLPGGRDELLELDDRGLPEDRRRVADEVDPELAGDLLDVGFGTEPHQPFLEALGLERAGERLLDDEHGSMAARPQDLTDPDAVVGGTERALGKEDDRSRLVAHGLIIAESGGGRLVALHGGTSSQVPPSASGPPCAPS